MEDLQNRTAELALHVQTKEELVNKTRSEMEPLIKTATRNLEMDVLSDVEEVSPRPRIELKGTLSTMVSCDLRCHCVT